MAFIEYAIPNRYVGAAGDTKPTGVGVGSICYEYDTADEYITYDGTNWVLYMGEGGSVITVTKTLAQGTEPISVNLFSFTGNFRLKQLYGVITEATDASDCDDAFFNLYDGANVIDLSDDQSASGVTLTNCTVGSVFGITDAATVDMIYQKSDQARYLAAANVGSPLWQSGLVIAKNGSTNYVRFTYDSAAASGIDIDIKFVLVYEGLYAGANSVLTAV